MLQKFYVNCLIKIKYTLKGQKVKELVHTEAFTHLNFKCISNKLMDLTLVYLLFAAKIGDRDIGRQAKVKIMPLTLFSYSF